VTLINGSSTKTSDLLREDSVLFKLFSVLLKVILKVHKDHLEMTGLCGYPLSYTVYLCAKQLNKNVTMLSGQIIAPNVVQNVHTG